jgi:hypothetical protein
VPSASINFPATVIGETSSVTVPLFNSGSGALVVDSVSLQNNAFSTASGSFIISSGVTHNLTLQFTPDTVGSNQTSLLFYTDSQTSPAAYRSVYGTGYEGFFNVVEPTGLPYTVVVDSLVGPLDSIQAGDEIGIFDDSTPVGVVVADQQITTTDDSLLTYSITTSPNQYCCSYGIPDQLFDGILYDDGGVVGHLVGMIAILNVDT